MNAISKWTIALILLSGAAHAQNCTTLVYIGKPITILEAEGPTPLPVSLLIGTVTLSVPLPANGTTHVTPAAWDFSAEDPSLNSVDFVSTTEPATVFWFETKNGAIVAWDVELHYDAQPMHILVSSNTLDNIDKHLNAGGDSYIPSSSISSGSTQPGTWYCLAPLLDPLTDDRSGRS